MIDDVLIESDHALVERGRNTIGANGDMLEAIPATEWVTLVARPGDGPWGGEEGIDDAAFRKRILVEEYGG